MGKWKWAVIVVLALATGCFLVVYTKRPAFKLEGELAIPLEEYPNQWQTVAFQPHGLSVLYSSLGQSPMVYNLQGLSSIPLRPGRAVSPEPMSSGMAPSPDGKFLVFGPRNPRFPGSPAALKIVDIGAAVTVREIPVTAVHQSETLAWSADGLRIARVYGGENEKAANIAIINAHTGDVERTIVPPGKKDDFVYSIAFSPVGRFFASGNWDGTAALWSVDTWEVLQTFELTSESPTGDHEYMLTVCFSPDGSRLAVGGGYAQSGGDDDAARTHGTIRIWNVVDRTLYRTIDLPSPPGSLSFGEDGSLLAFGIPGAAVVWDLKADRKVWSTGMRNLFPSVSMGPGGRIACVGGGGPIQIWRRVR